MGYPIRGIYNEVTFSKSRPKGKLVHGFERVTEFVVAGWLLFNMLGIALVAAGVARQYARAGLER